MKKTLSVAKRQALLRRSPVRPGPLICRAVGRRMWVRRLRGRFCRIRRLTGLERNFLRLAIRPVWQWNAAASFHRHSGPRLNLSIRPVVRQIVERARPGLAPGWLRAAPDSREAAMAVAAQGLIRPAPASVGQLEEPQPGAKPAEASGAMLIQRRRLLPVQRIFQRLLQGGEAPLHPLSSAAPRALRRTVRRVEETVQRIVRSTRRVEERSMVIESRRLRKRASVSAGPPQHRAARPSAFGAAGRNPLSAPAPARASPPSVDIEALTDRVMLQVDRRINVWRERTGRA